MGEPAKHMNHMVFIVRNLDEAVDFYTKILGMKVTMRFDDRRMAFLSFGEHLADIRLFEVNGTPDPDRKILGFNHLAIEPEGGIDVLEALHKRLIDNGVAIERTEGHAKGQHQSVYFFDPDGNRLEFYWESPAWKAESQEKIDRAFKDS
jgi:catechol 2,3-dioxygenase